MFLDKSKAMSILQLASPCRSSMSRMQFPTRRSLDGGLNSGYEATRAKLSLATAFCFRYSNKLLDPYGQIPRSSLECTP